jgi:hypothetical protein
MAVPSAADKSRLKSEAKAAVPKPAAERVRNWRRESSGNRGSVFMD